MRSRGVRACDRLLEIELLPDVDEHGDDLVEAVPLLLSQAMMQLVSSPPE